MRIKYRTKQFGRYKVGRIKRTRGRYTSSLIMSTMVSRKAMICFRGAIRKALRGLL